MSTLIWIQTAWHFDVIPERIFQKKNDFEQNQHTTKNMQNFPVGKELKLKLLLF